MLSLSRQSLIRISRAGLSRTRPICRNSHSNAEVRRPPGSQRDDDDFRPPWVYTTSRVGSVVVIPVIALYTIFVYDWGDHEHVFMPPRRWLARLKQSFFTLSPEEEAMLNKEIVEKRVARLPPIMPPLPPKLPSDKSESE
ncbi:pyridoxamine-phosphate oxidase [Coprinopsis cinerea AmutBmut pab1-1]|nr:pyridoxamine-phosphate oxidase [Coprinopsis cinerea AmutBmut pab1-1]